MYAMHYSQMMQFYNPNYQANSSAIPPFMTPPPFVPGNQVGQFGQIPNFMQRNQRGNFMPNNQGQHPMPNNQGQRQNQFTPPFNQNN